jgi:methylenetetrahydrofolate dehydrogenase (NADP+)/methenyltetrahydrofolate cyclohydrolase
MDKRMNILDGKLTAQKITENLKEQITKYLKEGKRKPRLDIFLVGEDFGSLKYVQMKVDKATELGINAVLHRYQEDVSQQKLEKEIEQICSDIQVDGLMVQLPLPIGLDQNSILEKIDPLKDVDGLTSTNLGKLFKNSSTAIAPATPLGIVKLLSHYNIDIDGMNAVVIGRSDIVGLPIAAMLQNLNATVTICHSHTKKLREITKKADLLVVGIGKAEYIDQTYIKPNSIIIDVGTNKNSQGKLVGDVNFDSVKDIVKYITPVPGGVGPMTISSLLLNLFESYKRNV